MPTTADIGTGTHIAFGTSAFAALVRSISHSGMNRAAIETTHLMTSPAAAGTFGSKTFIPGDLCDPGELKLEIHFNPDNVPPLEGVQEQVTITFPIPLGLTNGATWVFTGFVTGFEYTAPLEGLMSATMTLKVASNVVQTAAS